MPSAVWRCSASWSSTRIGWTGGFGLTVATFALQVPLSRWWLARFRYGPVEAAWRAATYGRWPGWRGR